MRKQTAVLMIARKEKMTYEEFKKLPLQEKVLFYERRYRLSYFCEDSCYIGCLKGNQGHIINLTMEGLPFLSVGWITKKIVKSKNPQEEIAELQDKLSRRNMQIRELKKRVEELEAFNNTFGDKRD